MCEFKREYQQFIPKISPRREIASDFACRYMIATESFDRSVCTGIWCGCAFPLHGLERSMINRNARDLRKVLEEEAECLGVSWKDIKYEMRRIRAHGVEPGEWREGLVRRRQRERKVD